MVELDQPFVHPPRAATLQHWRQAAPQDFVFVVKVWQLVTHEPSSPSYQQLPRSFKWSLEGAGHFRDSAVVQRAMARTLAVADLLQAPALLFESPPSFTPTAANRRALTTFFERCVRGRSLIWNPTGLWADDDVLSICRDLSLVPCWEPFGDGEHHTQGRPIPSVAALYLRPRGLGALGFTEHKLLWMLERLEDRELGFCAFGSPLLFGEAQRMQRLLEERLLEAR